MAIRFIRKYKDEILRKKCRLITKFDDRLHQLLDDMADTMYDAQGVGLAAPQVGVLRRAVVIDTGEGLVELINPKVVYEEGEQTDIEGCLSIPELLGEVSRPKKVKVIAKDRNGKEFEITGEDLLARALCHEIDHLSGILFIDKAKKIIDKKKEVVDQ